MFDPDKSFDFITSEDGPIPRKPSYTHISYGVSGTIPKAEWDKWQDKLRELSLPWYIRLWRWITQ